MPRQKVGVNVITDLVQVATCTNCEDLNIGYFSNSRRFASADQRMIIYARDNGTCQYCKQSVKLNKFHADHVNPWSKSHNSDISNLVTSCAMCNIAKHTMNYYEFKRKLETNGLGWRNRRYFAIKKQYSH